EFHGLWDSLVYDVEVKSHLLDYVMTTLLFSDKNVDSNLITWNRVVLLHGPPGTGKTSLCKALAQKLTIRLSSRYRYGQLIEINSHSLFSKWFSESGKLVTRMFQKIQDLIDDKEALVFVLIDEVESLTAARNACRAGAEPSDAIRVVNAVLTQIDQIKRHSNVVILTTSNITEKIDVAFVDRADIKQYIGPPSTAAIFRIYLSCLEELMKCQIIYPRQQLLTLRELEMIGFIENNVSKLSLLLSEISRKSEGLSGRVLRKLPFLAHALYIQNALIFIIMSASNAVNVTSYDWCIQTALNLFFKGNFYFLFKGLYYLLKAIFSDEFCFFCVVSECEKAFRVATHLIKPTETQTTSPDIHMETVVPLPALGVTHSPPSSLGHSG
ncbi:hypothetical protein STEG23_010740, partial [Scotinomys teguina]